jgi:mRNA interferase MazF
MVVNRGEIWWAVFRPPRGSEPGYRRPVVIVQTDAFNHSRIRTVVAAVVTSNIRLAKAPGNVLIEAGQSGLGRDSVANVSQVVTLDKSYLHEFAGAVPENILRRIDAGLRLVLGL